MSTQAIVSIIIPTYNAARWLQQSLDSVFAQEGIEKDIIIVDDGSTDESLAMAHKYRDRGVRVLAQTNCGAAAARNRGFAAARGEYIQFLDADDILGPGKIAAQVAALKEHRGAIASCRWGRFTTDPKNLKFGPDTVWRDLEPVDFLRLIYRRHLMMHPASWLQPRDVAEKAGPWDEKLTVDDDGEYFSRVVLAASRIFFVEEGLVHYRSGLATSLSNRTTAKSRASCYRSLVASNERLLERDSSELVRRAVAARYQRFLFALYPQEPEIRAAIEKRVEELGGTDEKPIGGKLFKICHRVLGWRAATLIERYTRDMRIRLHGRKPADNPS